MSKLYFEIIYISYNDGYLYIDGFYPVFYDKFFAEEFTDYIYKKIGVQTSIKEISPNKLKLLSYMPYIPVVYTNKDRRDFGNKLQFFSKREYNHVLL